MHPDLFDLPSPDPEKAFDGRTYVAERDHIRLKGQLGKVYAFMLDGKWHSLADIKIAIGAGSEAAISARLRDLRKEKYGSFDVQREHVKDGLHLYRLVIPKQEAAA